MLDDFKGEPINPFRGRIKKIRGSYRREYLLGINDEFLALLEAAGDKIAKLERRVSNLENRKTDD